MITNLFINFDPSTNIINIPFNWLITTSIIIILNLNFWFNSNYLTNTINSINNTLYKEFKKIIINNHKFLIIIYISLFLMILFNNLISLFPYIISITSHLIINISLSLPLWIRFFIYFWINYTTLIFKNIIPQKTPLILIPLIICIETIRLIISPFTLTIRLTANIITGHLILTLIRIIRFNLTIKFIIILFFIQFIFLLIEIFISVIQSYIFSILITLYSKIP